MTTTLTFLLTPAPPAAPGTVLGSADWQGCLDQHRTAIESSRTLKIHRAPAAWDGTLQELHTAGSLDPQGGDPFAPTMPARTGDGLRRPVCDATIPVFPSADHCLTALRLEVAPPAQEPGSTPAAPSVTVLFSLPLAEIENETCWFYPTEDGLYLAWEAARPAQFGPGLLPDQPGAAEQGVNPCRPEDLRVLWALMADDPSLTCVGFTCRRRRIEFPPLAPLPPATSAQAGWKSFRVASASERMFEALASVPAAID